MGQLSFPRYLKPFSHLKVIAEVLCVACSGPGAFLNHEGFCISSGCFTSCDCDPSANSVVDRDVCKCVDGFEERNGACVEAYPGLFSFFYKYSYTYVFIYSCMFDKIARKYVKVLIAVFNYEETTEPYTSTTLPFSTSPDYESSNQINLSQEPLMSPIKLRYFIIFDTYFQVRKSFLWKDKKFLSVFYLRVVSKSSYEVQVDA